MAIQVGSSGATCYKCGKTYSGFKTHFPATYSSMYKGVGYAHICKSCIEDLYNGYLVQCKNTPDAVRQVCRRLDLYWSKNVFDAAERVSSARSIMTKYIAKTNSVTYAGRSYEDTLIEEGTLWDFEKNTTSQDLSNKAQSSAATGIGGDAEKEETVPDSVIAFWGYGLDTQQYIQLEQRRKYWMSRLPSDMEFDIGTEAIIKQLCSLELDINRDRAAGRAVDKSVNALISLLGSAKLKPAQKKDDISSEITKTPMGVWAKRWEDKRPIPEDEDEETKNGKDLVRYVTTWFLGHLCKMLNIRNTYCKLYEDEIEKLRVENPEYKDEDDETLFNDIFAADVADDSNKGGD